MPIAPAANNTGNLPQSTVIHYDKNFRDALHSETPFVACCEPLELPLNSGNQYEIFQYVPFGADTSQVAEGAPGSSESVSVIHNTMTIGEYGDFVNFSSLSLLTAIDPLVENVHKELGYQVGETMSALCRVTADGASTIDASVNVPLAATTLTSYTALTLNAIRNSVQSLAGRSVKPFNESKSLYRGVIHPFTLGDVAADNSNDSPIDILKHTKEGLDMADELVSTNLRDVVEIPTSGVEFYQTNLVTQTSTYKSISNATALRTYIFGKDGVYRVRLAGPNDVGFDDGFWQNIMCKTFKNVEPSVSDPVGVIPAWCSYLLHFTTGLSPDPTQRLRTIDALSGVS